MKYKDVNILIEVKEEGKRDYNNEKTSLLSGASEEYMKKSTNKTILSIATVNNNNLVTYKFFSSNHNIRKSLTINDVLEQINV